MPHGTLTDLLMCAVSKQELQALLQWAYGGIIQDAPVLHRAAQAVQLAELSSALATWECQEQQEQEQLLTQQQELLASDLLSLFSSRWLTDCRVLLSACLSSSHPLLLFSFFSFSSFVSQYWSLTLIRIL